MPTNPYPNQNYNMASLASRYSDGYYCYALEQELWFQWIGITDIDLRQEIAIKWWGRLSEQDKAGWEAFATRKAQMFSQSDEASSDEASSDEEEPDMIIQAKSRAHPQDEKAPEGTPDQFTCVCCHNNVRKGTIKPCDHHLVCVACGNQLIARGAPCPECRAKISSIEYHY